MFFLLLGTISDEHDNPECEILAHILGFYPNDIMCNAYFKSIHEAEFKELGKTYEFHMYPGAGHGFFYYNRPSYRQQQAVEGWERIWTFLEKYLGSS